MGRRPIGLALLGHENPPVGGSCVWWRRWESNPRPRNSDRRFLRVQPAVKSHPMVGQQASFHTGQPEKSRPLRSGAAVAHLTSSVPDRRAEPRNGRGYLSSQCVVIVGSCSCLHPVNERMALDTLPTIGHVPRRTQYAPRFGSRGNCSRQRPASPVYRYESRRSLFRFESFRTRSSQ